MKVIYFLLFFISLNNVLYSQKITVTDNNGKPLPYANIVFFDDNKIIGGDYTNDEGILFKDFSNVKKMEISFVGFQTEIVMVKKDTNYNISMLPNELYLKEAVVTLNKNKEVTLGYSNKKRIASLTLNRGVEEVLYIDNKLNRNNIIKSFIFKIKKIKNDVKIRVSFYNYDKERNVPSDELLYEDIIFELKKDNKGIIELDVSEKNIIFPENGACIGIEVLDTMAYNDNLNNHKDTSVTYELNTESDEPYTFIRNRFTNKQWENISGRIKELLKDKTDRFPNASFGIKVYD